MSSLSEGKKLKRRFLSLLHINQPCSQFLTKRRDSFAFRGLALKKQVRSDQQIQRYLNRMVQTHLCCCAMKYVSIPSPVKIILYIIITS